MPASALRSRHPVAVYRHLPRGWQLDDPLPPVHDGATYDYTSLAGLHGLIESKVAWASHVPDLNDPSERLYGWDTIRQRFRDAPPDCSRHALDEIKEILEYVNDPGDWYPRAFVLSASTQPDNLTQYRLYGQCQVEVAGGTWRAVAAEGAFETDGGLAEWRPVLYGPAEAKVYIDRMLIAAAAVLDAVSPEDSSDEGLTAMLALEVLALHIKNPAYEDEKEVRLVFSASRGDYAFSPKVRVAGDRLVTYLEATETESAREGFIRSVMLGPLAGGVHAVEAIKLHHRNHFQDAYGLSDEGMHVQLSNKPYRAKDGRS